jgi:GDP-D-mannose dehydratase
VKEINTFRDQKKVRDPLNERDVSVGNTSFKSNVVDEMLISGTLNFDLTDQGLVVRTDKRDFKVQFDESRFRPSEVPMLLSNAEKMRKELGVFPSKQIDDIINDQINYYLDGEHRLNII